MIDQIKKLIFSNTAKNSGIMLTGSVIGNILAVLTFVLIAKVVSPEDLGLLLTALTFTQIVADVIELGINPALVNFLQHQTEADEKRLVANAFVIKFSVNLLIFLILFIFAHPISILMNNSRIERLIAVSGFGILFLNLIGFYQFACVAKHKFLSSSTLLVLLNVFRLLAVGVLLLLSINDVFSIFLGLQICLIFLVIYILIKIDLYSIWKLLDTELMRKFLKFGLPVGASFAIAAVYTKLDQMFIFSLAGEAQAGIYGLANRLASLYLFVIIALTAVIAPRYAAMAKVDFHKYFQKSLLAGGVISIGIAVASIIAPYILPILFGHKYDQSILPFQLLSFGMILFLFASIYYNALLYHHKNSRFTLYQSIISAVLVCVLLYILVPVYGSIGAAISITLVYLSQLIMNMIIFHTKAKL